VDGVALRRHTHHFAAAPRERTQVTVGDVVDGTRIDARLINLFDGVWDFKAHDFGRFDQAFGMFAQLEDLARINDHSMQRTRIRRAERGSPRDTLASPHPTFSPGLFPGMLLR